MQAPSRFEDASSRAARRSLVAGVLVAVLLGVLLSALMSIVAGVVVMVLAAAGWALWSQAAFGSATERVVGTLGVPVSDEDVPGFANALEGVAILTGVAPPELRVIESEAANAMVVADRDSATVVVTSGLLAAGRVVEQEVIAAELLCRVRDGSAHLGTLVAGLPSPLRSIAGLSTSAVAGIFGEQRATRTDLDAVAVTRYPPGLIAAFERMAELGTLVPGAPVRTAHLWIAPAVELNAGADAALERTANQPLDYRISVLREL